MTTSTATTSEETSSDVNGVFDRILRVVRRANAFVLGFAKCNSPVQQRQMSQELIRRLQDKRVVEITLDEPIVSLLEELEAVIDVNDPPALVNVYGLEKSIYAQQDYSPVLGRLNNDRDLIRRACPTVLLLWLPDYALDKVVLSAPDFWAWRSGVYEFPTNRDFWLRDSSRYVNLGWTEISSFTQAEKQQELQRIEELLHTARALPYTNDRDKRIRATLLRQSGMLYAETGAWQPATQHLEESRRLSEEIHDQAGVWDAVHELAVIAARLGHFEQARALYEQNLILERQFGDDYRQAVSLTQIGHTYFYEGNLETAQWYYEQSLQKFQKLSGSSTEHLSNMANVWVALGNIESAHTNFDAAQELYQQALSVADRLRDRRLRAAILLDLAVIKQTTGSLTEAETLYQECLQIGLASGDKRFIAITQANLGELKIRQGHLQEAVEDLTNAARILQELQSPEVAEVMDMLYSLQERIETEAAQK